MNSPVYTDAMLNRMLALNGKEVVKGSAQVYTYDNKMNIKCRSGRATPGVLSNFRHRPEASQ